MRGRLEPPKHLVGEVAIKKLGKSLVFTGNTVPVHLSSSPDHSLHLFNP